MCLARARQHRLVNRRKGIRVVNRTTGEGHWQQLFDRCALELAAIKRETTTDREEAAAAS